MASTSITTPPPAPSNSPDFLKHNWGGGGGAQESAVPVSSQVKLRLLVLGTHFENQNFDSPGDGGAKVKIPGENRDFKTSHPWLFFLSVSWTRCYHQRSSSLKQYNQAICTQETSTFLCSIVQVRRCSSSKNGIRSLQEFNPTGIFLSTVCASIVLTAGEMACGFLGLRHGGGPQGAKEHTCFFSLDSVI